MLAGIVFGSLVTFCGLFLASKMTGFSIYAWQLLVVAVSVTAAGNLLPPIPGFVASIAISFFMLKAFSSSSGIVAMIIVSFLMTLVTTFAIGSLMSPMS